MANETEIGVSAEVSAKPLRSPEEKERVRVAVAAHRLRKKHSGENIKYNGPEITKKDKIQILTEERGIKNPRVLEVCLQLAEVAARNLKLVENQHLFRYGVVETRRAYNGEPPTLHEIEDEDVVGELISRCELHALFDFSIAWREPTLTFEDFLAELHKAKTDCFFLGRDILQKDFHECHKAWADYFPKFNPDTLEPNYDQEQMKTWLGVQAEKKDFLLIASRNAYKSSFSIVWLITAILCCPDTRALLVSETKPLSKGFIKALRGYFEVRNVNEPSRFQQLFPHYCIPAGDGSTLTFECPMAHLGLIQSSAEATSMDSTVAGNRADIILFDDPISNVTTGNETQRQASIDKYDLLLKLREVGGYSTCLGTPWHPEDLYATLLKRNEEDADKPLAFRIDPAWTVKPEAEHKELGQLVEDDVVLLFPTRLSWKFLQKEMKAAKSNGYRFFRSQNLCEFVPEDEDELKIHFDPDVLTRACVPQSAVPPGDTILSVDIAYSMSARADLTCISVIRLHQNTVDKKCMTVIAQEAERMRGSELAVKLVLLTRQYNPKVVLLEKGPTSDSLEADIRRAAGKYEVSVPTHYVTPSNVKNAKYLRIKDLEFLLNWGRLKFASGPYIDALFLELSRIDGAVSSSKKKDDRADTLALAAQVFRIHADEKEPSSEKSQDEMEKMRKQAELRAQHERIFGGGQYEQKKPADAPPEQKSKQTDPRLAQLAKCLPSGFRL